MLSYKKSILEVFNHLVANHPDLIPLMEKILKDNKKPLNIFSNIYNNSTWGTHKDASLPFFSGNGSHTPHIVNTYVEVIKEVLLSFEEKPNVVDLGCGDFNIGSKLRPFCNNYIACDVVPELIEFNKKQFAEHNVDFRTLDLTEDPLPPGDILFVRQVLMHLNNEQISRFIKNLQNKYKYLIVTENVPKGEFTPNLEHPEGAGADIRVAINSGVVLTYEPFNLQVKAEHIICEIPEYGVIRTVFYEL